MQTHKQTSSNRTPTVQAMAQIRSPLGEMIQVPQFSETELGIIATIARGKGLTVTSLADAIKAHEHLQNLTERNMDANDFPTSDYGHVSASQSHHRYQQPLSASSLSHAMPSQRDSEQALRPWLSVSSPYGTNQELVPLQDYNQTSAEYLHGRMTVNPYSPNVGMHPGLAQSSSFALAEPQNYAMTHEQSIAADWDSIDRFAPAYHDQMLPSEIDLEQMLEGIPLQEPHVPLTHPSFDDIDSWLELPQQENMSSVSASASTAGSSFGAENELGSTIETAQIDTTTQRFQTIQAPKISHLTPTLVQEVSTNTEGSSSTSSNSSWVVPTTHIPQFTPILARQDSINTETSSSTSSTSSNSSWVITPSLEKDVVYDSGSSSGGHKISRIFSDPSLPTPCRYEWTLPKRRRRDKRSPSKGTRTKPETVHSGSRCLKKRSAFQDQQTRETTARTRKLIACHRCRKQRIRCEPNPQDLFGQCLTCLAANPTMSKLPCLRYKVTSSISLYREQERPNPIWTTRWKDFTIQNLTEWASPRIRKIKITQGMGGSSYELEVREFVPKEGDLMEKFWTVEGVRKAYTIPPYAIVDLEKAAQSRLHFVNENVGTYIAYGINNEELLIRTTYERAMWHAEQAPREEERRLLRDALYLWVAARMSSMTEWLCGDDHLDMVPVTDDTSPYFNHTPIPPVMSAQFQIIAYSKILRPLKKSVVNQLGKLSSASNTRRNWFTIYLTYFILLHSCTLVTRRDEEYARQINLQTRFANPQSISEFHQGALVLLADFHYSNKGRLPFSLAENSEKLQELAEIAELNQDQVSFMNDTARLVRLKRDMMMKVREAKSFANDYYFISQLYDDNWTPSPIA